MSSDDNSRLARRLARETGSEVLFDAFSRGRYATDASLYQIVPLGVVVPRSQADLSAVLAIAHEEGVPLLPRGGGTSQSGQTVGESLVVDFSKYLRNVVEIDPEGRTCTVEPGIVLDELNRTLAPHGLWYPVDVSTSSRATIGGMAGNNSCGTRSLRYGIMRDRVVSIDASLADGTETRFAALPAGDNTGDGAAALKRWLGDLGRDNAERIAAAFPEVQRRVGGYNIDALVPNGAPLNLATLLVGSEGTLALSRRLTLSLAPLPRNKVVGVCHFPTFRAAMEAPQHLVALGPAAIELVDRTMIDLARDIAMFRPVVDRFVKGEPQALLLVEFAEETQEASLARLKDLGRMMGDLGLEGAVVEAVDPDFQKAIWEVRKSGLNIMMSMKTEGKPVSFIEDCAVPLEHLADYTERLTEVFARHGTTGTWYAHASVGCLHVRPVLNLKQELEVRKMRAIAEEAFALVSEYKGAHSGEHGDGLVRSEFHEKVYGREVVTLFEEVKDAFDPASRLNPGKIVRPPRMDDRSLFRYPPDYAVGDFEPALDWSAWPGAAGGFQGAVEMCNNNGACRKIDAGVMCPSFRITRNERDVTRGRANTLRLAISGQIGPEALASDAMADTLKLCVGCKGCRRECPTGVDMARMKIEVAAQRAKRRGLPLHDRLVAYLPRYAPHAARLTWLANLRDRLPGLASLSEALAGFSARRPLPAWRGDPFRDGEGPAGAVPEGAREVVLFADTFNRYFEPENLRAALKLLQAGGWHVHVARPRDGGRPLCCGRTFLAAGLVDEARAEARRLVDALKEPVARGAAVVGLEPSCLFTLKDEMTALGLGEEAERIAERAMLVESFVLREHKAGRFDAAFGEREGRRVLLHGHCHQKSFGAMNDLTGALRLVPGLRVETVTSSCCGMAGAFGYGADTYEASMAMGELALLPAVREAAADTMLAADGFSCRHQIRDGTGRAARHIVKLMADSL
ncbi:FAD-binding protein [Kaustia mangrovi]|uniref:FAD-binding protein n=1 Tax=Kaustia mangrovi TaxID=2593653 RepID=A0A7S8C5C4_9HYPH|nr:FAD-binding oxidoreductase [Kaustia mangrovi]QPC43627.1 FAD-binding protein [Kaustia mangrovi]